MWIQSTIENGLPFLSSCRCTYGYCFNEDDEEKYYSLLFPVWRAGYFLASILEEVYLLDFFCTMAFLINIYLPSKKHPIYFEVSTWKIITLSVK